MEKKRAVRKRPLLMDGKGIVIKPVAYKETSPRQEQTCSGKEITKEDSEEDSFDAQNPSGKQISKKIAQLSFDLTLCGTEKDPHYYVRNRNLTQEEFRHALDIYTNNQDYFLEEKDYLRLQGLEHWFIHIIEPMPKNNNHEDLRAWYNRESSKRLGCSYSCSREAIKKIHLRKNDLIGCFQDLDVTVVIFELLKKKRGWNKKKKCSAK